VSETSGQRLGYQDILAALADATNDLSMPCHEQCTGAATEHEPMQVLEYFYGTS